MNYTLNLPLEHIAIVKVATVLWNIRSIRDLIVKVYNPLEKEKLYKNWEEIEDAVNKNVQQLPLSQFIKEKITNFIKPIGFQIVNWIQYHTCLGIRVPNEFYFTSQGAVDKKKTAEVLIKDGALDIITCYKLACTYGLEDDIQEFWNKIPRNRRKSLFDRLKKECITVGHCFQHELLFYWTYRLNADKVGIERMFSLSQTNSHNQCAFKLAATAYNEVATKYLVQKLTPEEREQIFEMTTNYVASTSSVYHFYRKEYSFDVLCVLLSQMDEEQQMTLFKRHPSVLQCLLDWPRQILFKEILSRIWTFIPKDVYGYLLFSIIFKLRQGFKDFNYHMLFEESWLESPNSLKKYILEEYFTLFNDLFEIKDKNNIELVFQNATDAQKHKIICSNTGLSICGDLMKSEDWDLLKFFIQECLSSKNELKKFQEKFKKYCRKEEFKGEKSKLGKFLQLLHGFTFRTNVRKCVEDKNSSKAKRFRNN